MQMKKMINAAMIAVVISFMGMGMAVSANANCPDKVDGEASFPGAVQK